MSPKRSHPRRFLSHGMNDASTFSHSALQDTDSKELMLLLTLKSTTVMPHAARCVCLCGRLVTHLGSAGEHQT